jgi:hypothetical protein
MERLEWARRLIFVISAWSRTLDLTRSTLTSIQKRHRFNQFTLANQFGTSNVVCGPVKGSVPNWIAVFENINVSHKLNLFLLRMKPLCLI